MLNLIELYGENVCQHAKIKFDLRHRVVGVLGDNATGKTNLTNVALSMALTGYALDASGRELPREEILMKGADKGHVGILMEMDGVEYDMRWNLHNGNQSLEFNGNVIRKATDCREKLETLYGMACKAVISTCFMPQDGAKKFLWMTPAARQDDMKSLFESIDNDAVMSDVQKVVNEIGNYPDRTDEKNEATLQLNACEGTVIACEKSIAEKKTRLHSSRPAYENSLGRMQQPIAGNQTPAIQKQQVVVDNAEKALSDHEKLKVEPGAEPPKPDPEGQRKQLLLEQYSEDRSKYDELKSVRDGAKKKLDAVAADEDVQALTDKKVAATATVTESETALTAQTRVVAGMKVTADLYATGGTCPVTQQSCPVVPDEEKRRQFAADYAMARASEKDLLKVLNSKKAAVESLNKQITEARRKNSENETTRRIHAKTISDKDAEMASLNKKLQDNWRLLDGFDLDAFQATVDAHGAWDEKVAASNEHNKKTLNLRKELDAFKTKLNDLKKPQAGITQAEHDAAQTVVDLYKSLEDEIDADVNELSNAKNKLAGLKEKIRGIEDLEFEARICDLVRTDIDAVRMFFHRSNGPAHVIRSNLDRYNQAIAKNLEPMNFGLRAWVETDFRMLYDKPETGVFGMPVTRLSGAEGIGVAVSEKLGRIDVTECRIPLLVLDEPAAPLSANKMQDMVALFERLRVSAAGKWTIIVPSHAKALESCFDEIIRLK